MDRVKRISLTAGGGLLAAAVVTTSAVGHAASDLPRRHLIGGQVLYSRTERLYVNTRPDPDASDARVQKISAAALYAQHCEMCHGPKGVSTQAPEMNFKGRTWKHGTSSAAMAKVIRDGIEATAMMPFNQKLSAAEITALAKLVRSFDPSLKPERAGGS